MKYGSVPSIKISEFARPVSIRAKSDCSAPVYAVTKHNGMMPSSKFFKKQVFSRDVEGYKIVRKGQFAYATIHLDEGSIGVLEDCDEALISPMYTVFEVDVTRVSPRFLIRLLKSDWALHQYQTMGNGSVHRRRAISFDALGELEVKLPPVRVQEQIALTLDKASEISRKRSEAIKLADEFLRSVFLDMFGDPVTNPKGWQTAKLGTIAKKIGSGATPMGGDSVYKTSGISFIRSLNVHDHKFVTKDLAHLDAAQAGRLANVEVMSGDVLLNITGASVARCCLVPEYILPARVNQHVCIIRPNEKLNSAFLESHLVCETVKRVLLGIGESMGATRQAITKAQLEAFPIIVPPIAEQERFAKVVAKVRQQKLAMEEFANQSEMLFQSIQQQAFA